MPSKSKAQHRLMAAVAHDPAFAKKAGIPVSVGQDFVAADKGYAEGGRVGMEHKQSHSQDASTQPLSGSALKALVRGRIAGTAGIPGDLEELARKGINWSFGPGGVNVDEQPFFRNTEGFKQSLPGKQPGDEAMVTAGSLFGGFGVPQAPRGVKGALTLLANAPRAPLAGSRAAQQGVIKAPGGNWLSGSIEDALKGLKRPDRMMQGGNEITLDQAMNWPGLADGAGRDKALNSFIDKQLTRYVKNDMATERDPIRALAERGVLHYDPHGFDTPRLSTRLKRQSQKVFPPEQAVLADSDVARRWENASDSAVASTPMAEYQAFGSSNLTREQPWIAKIDPETPMYRYDAGTSNQDLGFSHLIDELRNATNPASGLPPQLRLNPEDLAKVSVPQAVERVAQINQWRAEQKAAADLARANNAATVLHKDYPEKGYKWVELKKGEQLPEGWGEELVDTPLGKLKKLRDPKTGGLTATDPREEALRDALKYEGDTMGHCVGGYCPDVLEGRSRIFSLRDKKGEPHVTVEVAPGRVDRDYLRSLPDPDHPKANEGEFLGTNWTFEDYVNRHRKGNGDQESFALQALAKHGHSLPPEKIVQIKGKQNRKPNDEYLPFVQDFVRSGKWSDVGDLHHTGFRRATDAWNPNEEKLIRAAGIEFPTYATQREIDAINQQVWPGLMGPAKQRFVDGGSVKATPRMPVISNAADLAKAILDFGAKPFGYDNPPVRMAIDALNLQAIPKTLDEISYGGALGTGSGMTWKPKADTVDAALMLAPTLAKTAPQLARGVKGALTLLANAPRAPLAGSRAAQRGVIKAPGGNWLSGSIEDALKGLKQLDIRGNHPETPINNWIDKKLANYVRNDMATDRDPIRALAERGVLHYTPQPTSGPVQRAMEHRVKGGFPAGGYADSELARNYETMTDSSIGGRTADEWMKNASSAVIEKNSWIAKVPPEVPIYEKTSPGLPSNLGFDHLMDELRNAIDINSGLPPQLRLKPEDLAKVTVPQAVQRVAQINQWRAEQKAAADLARANNAATVLHKDYPEQGYKWVELRQNADNVEGLKRDKIRGRDVWLNEQGIEVIPGKADLQDALKYEGDIMQHCVGRYCDDVASGRTRIFSLRDAKGQPHVTVEVEPGRSPIGAPEKYVKFSELTPEQMGAFDEYSKSMGNDPLHLRKLEETHLFNPESGTIVRASEVNPPARIVQIKGKQNRKPNDEYLPFVQDFVRSGKWSDVGDLQNTGLLQATRGRFQSPEGAGQGWMPRFDELGIPEGYYTNDELVNHIQNARKKAGYASGGSVKAPTWQDAYEEFQKAHREQYGIGIDRPWSKDEDAARAKQQIDQRYIAALNRYDPTLTPDASVLGVNAQPNTYVPKPDKGGWFSQQLSNVGNIFRPVVQGVDDLWKDTTQAASSTVNEAAQLGSEATGGILSPDAVKVLAAAAYLASTGDFANAAKMTAPEAMGEIALSSAPEFAWTDAVASSLDPSLLGSPTISGLGGATYSDAVLAQLTGEGGRMGLNAANVGQTADQILAARNATDFLSANTPGLFKTGAGMAGGPVGSLTADIGGAVLKGAPLTQAATGAVGSLALGKAVQEAAKQTGLPPQLLAVGANTGITGTAPTTQDLGKIAVSTYAADQARQRRAPRRRV